MAAIDITQKGILVPVTTNELLGTKDGVLARFEIDSLPTSAPQNASIQAVNSFSVAKRSAQANALAYVTGASVTEANVNTGTVDARATLAATDTAATSQGTDVFIPSGTWRVDSNLTFANHVVVRGKVKPASGITVTFSKGYTALNDNVQVFDISAGGTVALSNQSYTSINHWGAIADYTYPNNGTDNTAAIVAAGAALQAMVAAASSPDRIRPLLIAPPNCNYRIVTPIYFGDYYDIDFQNSWIRYRGSDKTQAIIKVGNASRYAYWGDYNINVDGVATDLRITPAQAKTFAGIRLTNVANCRLRGTIQNVAIGLQMYPEVGGLVSTCNIDQLHLTTVKTGIEIHGNTSGGYVNENVINRVDFTYSPADTMGSTYGVVFTAEAGGYSGLNNNRILDCCFQVGQYTAAMNITVGKTVEAGYYYVTRSNNREYYCSATGTGLVATVPSHTSGTVTDANGVAFEYVGTFMRIPVLHDNAGSLTKGIGNRWETGDGPFAWCKNATAQNCRDNDYEVYMRDANARAWPMVDHTTGRTSCVDYAETTRVRVYGQPDTPASVVNNLHKRFIKSSTMACIKGCAFYREGGANQWQQACTGNSKLLKESVYYDSLTEAQWTWFGTLVDLSHYAGYLVAQHCNSGTYLGSTFVQFFDEKFVRIGIAGTSDVGTAIGSHQLYDSGDALQITELFGAFRRVNRTPRYAFLGYGFNGVELTGFSVSPTWDGQTYIGSDTGMLHNQSFMQVPLSTKYESDANSGNRFAYGTPTVGYFERVGERIDNINIATGQPVCWYVKTPGIMAPAWASGATSIRATELRSNGGNVYYANTAGTAGTTAPTGTTTSNDGLIVWTYLNTVATLQASSETYT